MAISRYDGRTIVRNRDIMYKKVFKDRGVKQIRQYMSPKFAYPTPQQIGTLDTVSYTWKLGDRLYKIADYHYGDSRLWWVIAWYNKKPTEYHISIGDIIHIPFPLDRILRYLDV